MGMQRKGKGTLGIGFDRTAKKGERNCQEWAVIGDVEVGKETIRVEQRLEVKKWEWKCKLKDKVLIQGKYLGSLIAKNKLSLKFGIDMDRMGQNVDCAIYSK